MKGKFVLITGPTSGIGLELAKHYASTGRPLFLVSRNSTKLKELQNDLDVSVEICVADLSSDKGIDMLFSTLKKREIKVDTLINNAGFGLYGAFEKQNDVKLHGLLDLNIVALMRITKFLLPSLIKYKGEIMNVSSIAGFLPGPYMANYYASKAYVNSFSLALREEMRDKGVIVSLLCPGPTATGFGKRANGEGTYLDKGLMSAKKVALLGVRGLEKNKAVVIPGFKNKLIVGLVKYLPRWFVVRMISNLQKKNH